MLSIILLFSSCQKAPQVCFSTNQIANKMNGKVNMEVEFVAVCDRDAQEYVWNWGDGTGEESGTKIKHTYTVAGTYNVCLTGFNNKGKKPKSTSVTQEFTVSP
jgi:PKD repeat protein